MYKRTIHPSISLSNLGINHGLPGQPAVIHILWRRKLCVPKIDSSRFGDMLKLARVRVCKRLRSPGFDSKELITPPAYVARRAGTTTLFVLPARRQNPFLTSLKVYKFGIWRRLISIATNRSFGDLKAETTEVEAPRQPMESKV